MIKIKGEAYGQKYDYECALISRTSMKVVLNTNTTPSHTIELSPRYAGSIIGSNDIKIKDEHATICAFYFNGYYDALAFFIEQDNGDIFIIPHEY